MIRETALCFACGVAGTLLWTSALAATPEAAPEALQATVLETEKLDQKTLDAAEAAFFEGLVHYRAARYEQAAQSFQKAWSLARHRDMLFNVAQSREKLGDIKGAVEWYRTYLETRPTDETAVIHRIRQLGEEPNRVGTAPAPRVDEVRVERVEAGAGPWPWVAAGVAVVAAAGGTVVGLGALDEASSARSATLRADAQKHKDAAESGALTADLLFGVSAVSAAAAVYLWWRADAATTGTEAALEVGAAPSGGWLGVTGRF
jgi:tetratricopeptide (TPR) repeat protein